MSYVFSFLLSFTPSERSTCLFIGYFFTRERFILHYELIPLRVEIAEWCTL